MSKHLQKALAKCIRDVEAGACDVEASIRRYPELEKALRLHLEEWSNLQSAPLAEVAAGALERGRYRLLSALADLRETKPRTVTRLLNPAAVKAAAVVAGVALLAAGSAGASAALGGPDIGGEALSAVGINHAPDAAQNGKDHANPNAFEGSDNAGQGIENASENGQEHANENAFGDHGKPDSTGDSAAEDGLNTANDHASENADQGLDKAQNANPSETPSESDQSNAPEDPPGNH